MDGSSSFLGSLFGYVWNTVSDAVDHAIAKLEQEKDQTLSDEVIARQLQEKEDSYMDSILDGSSHQFNRPTVVIPVQTGPLSRISSNWNSSYEENETDDFHTNHQTNGLSGHDHHEHASDNINYEELQELSEDIDSENKGLSDKKIASLHKSKYRNSKKQSDNCAICQSGIRKGEKIIILPCKHFFHKECITPWLKINKVCPNCKYEIKDN